MKRAYGWVRSKRDPRDRQFVAPRRITANLPATFDLSAGMGPQLDQGTEGSCGPNTVSELITFDQIAEKLPRVAPSRQFIYWNTRVLQGDTSSDTGVQNRTMLQALAQSGFCPESQWPYLPADEPSSEGNLLTQPSAACFAAAVPNKITNYAAVQQTLGQMKGTLVSGRPWIFGFTVFPGMETEHAALTGIVPNPRASASPVGGHDVSFVGYSDVQAPGVLSGNTWPAGTFKFRNHWYNDDGTPWGDGGYGYLHYTYGANANLSGDFWVINAVPGSAPTASPGSHAGDVLEGAHTLARSQRSEVRSQRSGDGASLTSDLRPLTSGESLPQILPLVKQYGPLVLSVIEDVANGSSVAALIGKYGPAVVEILQSILDAPPG